MEAHKETFFERKIKPLLSYIGTICAILMSIAYIITVFVLIFGFKAEKELNLTIFAIVNAAVGLIIMQFLKVQGVSFAKMIPENKKIIEEYYQTRTKDKKVHNITYFWITSVIKDTLVKCLTIGASTFGIIYLVIEGSKDYKLILLAVINLIMFISFGFLSLVKAYDFYNENHIEYMKDKIKEAKKELDNAETCPEISKTDKPSNVSDEAKELHTEVKNNA